jgi:succinyl-diaminopimelate desuccinylase
MANPLTPDVLLDPVVLTRALVDIESVSRDEKAIADCVEDVLRKAGHLSVRRVGNTVMARTRLGHEQRVILAGHLDTVPVNGNLPSTVVDDLIYGCGTSDMKSGVALALHLAVTLPDPRYDVTYLFYEAEEIESEFNGLNLVADEHPKWLRADLAVLLEPTFGAVEAGCQGTMHALVRTKGRRAHTARSWRGLNAIHAIGEVLRRLGEYHPRTVTIDGCTYREGLSAVRIAEHLHKVFDGFDLEIIDSAPGALPGLDAAPAREFVAAIGVEPAAKLGWTDVARFAALGIPALNYGPGDPSLAHAPDEHVEIGKIRDGAATLYRWLAP